MRPAEWRHQSIFNLRALLLEQRPLRCSDICHSSVSLCCCARYLGAMFISGYFGMLYSSLPPYSCPACSSSPATTSCASAAHTAPAPTCSLSTCPVCTRSPSVATGCLDVGCLSQSTLQWKYMGCLVFITWSPHVCHAGTRRPRHRRVVLDPGRGDCSCRNWNLSNSSPSADTEKHQKLKVKHTGSRRGSSRWCVSCGTAWCATS